MSNTTSTVIKKSNSKFVGRAAAITLGSLETTTESHNAPHGAKVPVEPSVEFTAHKAEMDQLRTKLLREHKAELLRISEETSESARRATDFQNEEIANLTSQLNTALNGIDAAIRQFYSVATGPLAELAITIASAVVEDSLSESSIDVVTNSVTWAIEELASDQMVDVYLNPMTLMSIRNRLLPDAQGAMSDTNISESLTSNVTPTVAQTTGAKPISTTESAPHTVQGSPVDDSTSHPLLGTSTTQSTPPGTVDMSSSRVRWHARADLAESDWIASTPDKCLRRVRSEVLARIVEATTHGTVMRDEGNLLD